MKIPKTCVTLLFLLWRNAHIAFWPHMLERFAAFFLLKYPTPMLHFFPFPLLSSLRFIFSDTKTGSPLSLFFSSCYCQQQCSSTKKPNRFSPPVSRFSKPCSRQAKQRSYSPSLMNRPARSPVRRDRTGRSGPRTRESFGECSRTGSQPGGPAGERSGIQRTSRTKRTGSEWKTEN